jgi:aldehyde dehydrogenase (NAD+)
MLSFVCGNAVVWKTSEKSPLCGLACHTVVQRALARFVAAQDDPAAYEVLTNGLHSVIVGDAAVGEAMAENPGFSLVSATGSTRMGRAVAQTVAARLGRSLLELGGNNAAIITPEADLKLAIPAVVFSAVGTTGQRCTTLRRLFVHASLMDKVTSSLVKAYESVTVGDPRLASTHVGPLIDDAAIAAMQAAVASAQKEGGELLAGGEVLTPQAEGGGDLAGHYIRPALLKMPSQSAIVCEETFAPILYVMAYDDLSEAIALNNAVPQGLSSSIFTDAMREAETFLSPAGSDCGIVNVNVGTSGAEIGGAFGGEKETGGGRESGSDAWKSYMRRVTNTVNYSDALPLAQGVKFDI